MEQNTQISNQSTVLVVEDDLSLREALTDTLELAGYDVVQADNGRSALDYVENPQNPLVDMVISDVQMPKMNGHQLLKHLKRLRPELPVLIMTAYGTIDKAIEAMKDGATDYLVKPFEPEVLVSAVSQFIGDTNMNFTMIAEDPSMQELSNLAKRVADSDATVMISGSSGTGKEILARYIHQYSPRAEKPFIAINCAAIPENMLEATLFGYEKGAFTGAYKSSMGKFEQAQGGTLLLDEISEMDLGLQAKILRVLQEKEVERLGGHELIQLDVRILATSNRNMHQFVQEGKFREDLFYRLNVFPMKLPDLKDRPQDIIPLTEHLVEKSARANGRAIPLLDDSAKQKLLQHTWPGNIRELENVVQRAFILHMEEMIKAVDIVYEQAFSPEPVAAANMAPVASVQSVAVAGGENLTPDAPVPTESTASVNNSNSDASGSRQLGAGESLNKDLKNREYQVILDILSTTMGNRKMAAERLGISQRTLRYKLAKMRELGMSIPGGFANKVVGANPA